MFDYGTHKWIEKSWKPGRATFHGSGHNWCWNSQKFEGE
jgi:hypothetical protein